MSAGHTPGPWEAHQGVLQDQPTVWDVTTRNGLSSLDLLTPQGWFVATVHELPDEASAEANARLIAAAPELLEALSKAILWIPTDVVRCNGDKCREPNCASCYGDEQARAGADEALSDLAISRAAIAKAIGVA